MASLFRARRSRRAAVVVTGTAVLVLLAACSSAGAPRSSASGSAGPVGSGSPAPAAVLSIKSTVPFDAPATFSVRGGTLRSATVKGHVHGTPLPGHVEADGRTWVSDELPVPSARYDVQAVVHDAAGDQTLKGSFAVSVMPAKDILGYDVTPFEGWTVGVSAPIVVRFHRAVVDRAAVERNLTVYSSTPVTGSWHWVNAYEVHFRAQYAWAPGTEVRLSARLHGVKAGPSLWAVTDTTVDFTIGPAHLTKVDGLRHTLTVYVSGRPFAVWPTSLGRPEFATRTGNYIVLAKEPSREMTSCSAHITCSKTDPNWYDLTVNWDVRLTYSGTFIHSAPWSVSHQGVDNVSHGCINLSPAHAITYFNLVRYGDLVTVTGTSRGPADLLQVGDPGMTDWNTSWASYVAGSALGGSVVTSLLH